VAGRDLFLDTAVDFEPALQAALLAGIMRPNLRSPGNQGAFGKRSLHVPIVLPVMLVRAESAVVLLIF
jgi:hypothetical protein